jgi:hypothetical protein
MLADGTLILAAGLAVLVVCAVTSRQDRRAERVAGGAPPVVTPLAAAEPGLGGSKSLPPPSAA